MAFKDQRQGIVRTYAAASALTARTVVKAAGASLPNSVVQVAASVNEKPLGITPDIASIVRGANIAVFEDFTVCKAIAGASLGADSDVGFATLGLASAAQGTRIQATVVQLGPVVGASGVTVWSVGKALSNAGAGEVFALEVRPRQLSGLV